MQEENQVNHINIENTESTEDTLNNTEKHTEKIENTGEENNEKNIHLRQGLGGQEKKGLLVIIIVVVLVVGGLVGYNYYQNRENNDNGEVQVGDLSNFLITREVIKQDFKNEEKKLKSDVIPPASYQARFTESINKSLDAIKTGVPSQSDFKDLKEDYFNIASSYSILGDYEKSEEYYLKVLEQWPTDYKANMNLGDLYILMGQYQDTANKYLDTIVAYPADARIYSKLADIYVKRAVSEDKLDKADEIYQFAIKQANNPKELYKNYSFFLENYLKDYERALEMEREYQKITGSKAEQEIERLEKMIK